MSLLAASLVPLLIESGPTLIRSIGNLFGSQGKKAADVTADIVESVAGLAPANAEHRVRQQLQGLPPETLEQLEGLRIQLERIALEREKNQLDYQRDLHRETQQTIRHGDRHGTDYVKETRPKIARMSTYAALLYAFVFQGLAAFDQGSGVDWWVLGTLFSPALTYMGVRTIDAFSRFKKLQ